MQIFTSPNSARQVRSKPQIREASSPMSLTDTWTSEQELAAGTALFVGSSGLTLSLVAGAMEGPSAAIPWVAGTAVAATGAYIATEELSEGNPIVPLSAGIAATAGAAYAIYTGGSIMGHAGIAGAVGFGVGALLNR